MYTKTLLTLTLAIAATNASRCSADETTKYLLQPRIAEDDTASISLELKVGGEMLFREKSEIKRLPLSVTGELKYDQQIIAWSAEPAEAARSLRNYQTASATFEVGKESLERNLPNEQRSIIAELREGHSTLVGSQGPLTRSQLDLLDVVGNPLAIDRLLPGRELAEGDSWDHDKSSIGALLGMDHVAVCEVSSVVIGQAHKQVQIRLAGTVHGTIDGASTEIDLRGAYLFHLRRGRITKFNLAVKEKRAAGQVVPGLDVVAKIQLTVGKASTEQPLDQKLVQRASDLSKPLQRNLLYKAEGLGFYFLHDMAWYVTAEQSDLLSLRCLQEGDLTAHCNVSTLPARSEGRQTTLEQFERDVRESLGDNLKSVTASTQWKNAKGHDCLGVIAVGKFEGVPVEWRYYLIAADSLPRVSLSVTLEQSQIDRFDDADRQIIDSIELMPKADTATAAKDSGRSAR